MAEFIRLHPSLPWKSDLGVHGRVNGCAPDRLLLETDAPQASFSSITISLEDGQDFRFNGRVQGESAQGSPLQFVVAPEQQGLLQDLIGQIRKDQHIEICRSQDVEASDRFTGFQDLSFIPETLPLVDGHHLNTGVNFLGRQFSLPLLITGMTGGIRKGADINRRLAKVAQAFNIPMGVGSQRIALENPDYASIFQVKDTAPEVYLIGNIGIAQLSGPEALDRCQRAVDMIRADALALHFNLVQEYIQVEGDRHFAGILKNIETICKKLSVPVIAKEVGSGISPDSARRLYELGVKAIDIGGAGGTSWARIEGLRSSSDLVARLGQTFRNWGIPTAYSLAAVKEALPDLPLIATGGIRDGLTAAKAVGLGASFTGIGLPLLRAALTDDVAPFAVMDEFKRGLELTMVASGCRSLPDLKSRLVRGRPYADTFERLVPKI